MLASDRLARSEYNAGLKQRGSLTFWLDEDVLEQWLVKKKTGKKGASQTYSDMAIATMSTVKSIFSLAGRQTEGFVSSLFELMSLDLPVLDHSTVSRRLGSFKQRQSRATIPPRKNATVRVESAWETQAFPLTKISQHGNCKAPPLPRDENLRAIRKMGRKKWKRESGYHRRSLAETTMFRLKCIFGGKLASRQFDNQAVELFLQCSALNRMIQICKPESYVVEL